MRGINLPSVHLQQRRLSVAITGLNLFMINSTDTLLVSLTIIRYPKKYIFFALCAMAIHRLPLLLSKKIHFYKLLGCGKGGGFSKTPDWQQWAILTVRDEAALPDTRQALLKALYGKFVAGWYRYFRCETNTFLLSPVSGHGSWDGQQPFGPVPYTTNYSGRVAVLTRATIRLNSLPQFWAHVKSTADILHTANGLLYTVSIGELPFIKQATFSIWNSVEEMKAFAYQTQHKEVIKKTHEEKWYREELFVRFRIVAEISK
ncbi:MAG: DUF3291 domain-containing protein [Agriterribacter sp.]